MIDNSARYSTIFSADLRTDYESNPIQQLQHMLAHVGLKLTSIGSTKSGGIKRYRYQLDTKRLEFASSVTEARKKTDWKDYMEGLASS